MEGDDESRRISQLEWRVNAVEQSIKLLGQLSQANARINQLEEAQTNSERRIAELADAQRRAEETILKLSATIEALTTDGK